MKANVETEERYRAALELYRTSTLSIREICRQTQTRRSSFSSYLQRVHRELMFARHGINLTAEEAQSARLRKTHGQSVEAHAKYGAAIAACNDRTHIEYNVSQIARMYHLNPSSLSQQLRKHFPEILEHREKERLLLGLSDDVPRGAKKWCREQYAEAVEHLRNTDDTIRETAQLYNLSYSGLREHMLYYHKDIVDKRSDRRLHAKTNKKRGGLTGSGTRHIPSPEQVEKYGEAERLYRTTAMTQKEIAAMTGVPLNGLRNYLRTWYPELILEHRGVICGENENIRISDTKHYLKSTAAKYAHAIQVLKATGRPVAEVAKEADLNPETFRMYLHEHEPELAAQHGMTRLPNGRLVSTRSMTKYAEAIRLYRTSAEPLRSIADRMGLVHNSIAGFIRRNYPEVMEIHKRLAERADLSRK